MTISEEFIQLSDNFDKVFGKGNLAGCRSFRDSFVKQLLLNEEQFLLSVELIQMCSIKKYSKIPMINKANNTQTNLRQHQINNILCIENLNLHISLTLNPPIDKVVLNLIMNNMCPATWVKSFVSRFYLSFCRTIQVKSNNRTTILIVKFVGSLFYSFFVFFYFFFF